MVPRILMGLLAVLDTLLIYNISERRYNSTVALIASILFAVMPITWLTRRIFVDSIQLPFLLSSILFADYTSNLKDNRKVAITLLSGTFLGLAIFTKIPAFTMIPLVGVLIYGLNNNTKSPRVLLGLWLVPVILIPMIWPVYALSIGEFRLWESGVLLQLHRISQPLVDSVNAFFKNDPVLFLLGIAGLGYAALKRDYFVLLWIIPFLIFLYIIGYVSLFHFIPLIPALCIAAARLTAELPKKIINKKVQQALVLVVISGIAIFGLASITALLTLDLNSSHFRAAAFVAQYLPYTNNSEAKNNKITIISDPFYSWIPQYVFEKNQIYKS
jgi:4-amino-4-deoxy-L-arabinose transferase-like glycosyltransferase